VIPLLLFVLLLSAIAFSFACNRDIFSPAKFYHASLTVYFVEIFLSQQIGYIYAIYLGFILGGMLMSVLEAYTLAKRHVSPSRLEPSGIVPARFVVVLWVLSIAPVLAQWYLIHVTGGFETLALTIARRVVAWRGLGPVVMLMELIAPINLVYFAVGVIYTKRRPGIWWLLYALHLFLFVAVASLRGGRAFLLMQLIFMMLICNYLRGRVKLRYALVTGGTLLVIAAFLGMVRNNLTRLDSLGRINDMRADALNLQIFAYGTDPLNKIFSQEFTDYQYGKTFLTPVTNLVPRRVWPGKFDSGGVVLTKFWLGRRYTGLTNMSTGLVTESILNFGYPLGLLSGFALLLLVIMVLAHFYGFFCCHIKQHTGISSVWLVSVYVYVSQLAGGLLYGEFQNHIGGALINLVLLYGVVLALRLRLFPSPVVGNAARRAVAWHPSS